MKKLMILAVAFFAMLAVSCDKTGPIDNTFTLDNTVYKIRLTGEANDEGYFFSTITFLEDKPLYHDTYVVDDINCNGSLGKHTLPCYNYFSWDYEMFESGTAKITADGDQIVMVVNALLDNGKKVKIRARSEAK